MSESISVSYAKDGVEIKNFSQNGNEYIHFHFEGKFYEQLSVDAIKRWKSLCIYNPSKKFVHIWDCRNMSGFEAKAKKLWMEQMDSLHNQTARIILISDNIIIRGAASLMSRFTKHSLTSYRTLDEMKSEELLN